MNRVSPLTKEFYAILRKSYPLPLNMIRAIKRFIFKLKNSTRSREEIDAFLTEHFQYIYISRHLIENGVNKSVYTRKPCWANLQLLWNVQEIVGYVIRDNGMHVHNFGRNKSNNYEINNNELNMYNNNQIRFINEMTTVRKLILNQKPVTITNEPLNKWVDLCSIRVMVL